MGPAGIVCTPAFASQSPNAPKGQPELQDPPASSEGSTGARPEAEAAPGVPCPRPPPRPDGAFPRPEASLPSSVLLGPAPLPSPRPGPPQAARRRHRCRPASPDPQRPAARGRKREAARASCACVSPPRGRVRGRGPGRGRGSRVRGSRQLRTLFLAEPGAGREGTSARPCRGPQDLTGRVFAEG